MQPRLKEAAMPVIIRIEAARPEMSFQNQGGPPETGVPDTGGKAG
jgi:hypothetical protein